MYVPEKTKKVVWSFLNIKLAKKWSFLNIKLACMLLVFP
ncbi:hypothetical protein LTSEADE_3634 [Salmonella enterica subsp. enterica serovar Adelaide str. A4-669]|uniref:Uncharacterized protein n=1 Tax=Salmonella enterica subsp. enterica serovar Adelaide str. A4-669 TaxID=913063 RepID=A0A6C8GL30_SALET|nr:hypothetical protein LTSEADE_3634 [Salmonella enterica subsp. enterica serovar Adelaide str. A4-669]